MDSRSIFEAWLAGAAPARPPVMPVLGGLAAQIGMTGYRQMTSDCGAWTAGLTRSVDLLAVDAAIVGFDLTLTAEALGLPLDWQGDRPVLAAGPLERLPEATAAGSRLAIAIETAGRLFPMLSRRVGCIAAMVGPMTLAEQMFGRQDGPSRVAELRGLQVQVAEAFCHTRPDLLLFVEGRALGGAGIGMPERKAFNTLRNVAHHFNVATAVYLHEFTAAALDSLALLNLDFILLGAPPAEDAALASLAEAGRGIGLAVIGDDGGMAGSLPAGVRNPACTSRGPLGAGVDIQRLLQTIKALKGEA